MDSNNRAIRFVNNEGVELFKIPDGASIRVIYPPGDGRGIKTAVCKYEGETHVKVGDNLYHIDEFASRMAAIGARYEPVVQLRDVEIVPFTPGEEKYFTYNREKGNSCIGHISGDFGNQGDRFFSSWSDRENGKNTPKFQTDLHSAMYALRQYLLKDHASMVEYCGAHPEAKLPDRGGHEHYGFTLDTKNRRYFVTCVAEQYSRDSRFIVYAYNKPVEREQKRIVAGEQDAEAAMSPFVPLGDWAMAKDYSGAERFEDGSRPVIAETKFADIVIGGTSDKDKICVGVHPYAAMGDSFYEGTVGTKDLAIQIGKDIATYIDANAETQFTDGRFKLFFSDLQLSGIRMHDLSPSPDYAILPADVGESKMFYRNDTENSLCVGYMRGDFGKNGGEFHHNWFDSDIKRNTPAFKAEFQDVVDKLRQDILKDLKTTQDFCYKHPEARLPGDIHRYGFKLETESRQYFVRCTTLQSDYFYVFAYDKAAPVKEQNRAADEKPSVLKQIRDAQKEPKTPEKKKGDVDL